MQESKVTADQRVVTIYLWLLDLHGDPSSTARPAVRVQQWLHEWLAICERREGEAPPAPPPPPPSAPPSPPPPTLLPTPPPTWWVTSSALGRPAAGQRTVDGGSTSIQREASVNLGVAGRSASGSAGPAQVLVGATGEPSGTDPLDFPCPLRVLNGSLISASDATPPSPPASPPPPPPPSPPSPPPSPPYIECEFIECVSLSDEEVEQLERQAITDGAHSSRRNLREAPPDPSGGYAGGYAGSSTISGRRLLGLVAGMHALPTPMLGLGTLAVVSSTVALLSVTALLSATARTVWGDVATSLRD